MLGQFGPQQNQSKYAKKMGDFAQEKAIEAQQKTEELETVIDENRFNFKGEVATRSAIPSSKSFGDAWFILDEGRTVRWNGTALENRNTNNPSQIQNLAAQLDDKATQGEVNSIQTNKADKSYVDTELNNISISQINKNSGKYDQTWMTEEFLLQMTGNAPVNATPPNLGVTRIKMADKSIPPNKTTFISTSSNLYNPKEESVGFNISNADGTLVANATYTTSGLIEVVPGSSLYLYGFNNVAYYNADSVFISRPVVVTSGESVVVPEGAYFIRVHFLIASAAKPVQINKGTVKLPYEQYSEKLSEDVRISKIEPNTVDTPNLKNKSVTKEKADFFAPSSNLYNKDLDLEGFNISSAGTLVANAAYNTSDFIPVEPSSAHYFYGFNNVAFYDVNKIFISRPYLSYPGEYLVSPSNAYFIRVHYQPYNTPVGTDGTKRRVNKGNALLDYEPFTFYFEGVDFSSEQIQKLEDAIDFSKAFDRKDVVMFDLPIDGVFDTSDTYPTDYSNFSTTTSAQVYQMFDDLMATYPSYITKTLLGNDSWGNPISLYKFIPSRPNTSVTTKLPKVFLTCGVHGYEHVPALMTYLMFKQMCEDWEQYPLLEVMRHNVEFLVIPVANPSGWDDYTRTNRNGVDINRNFASGWVQGNPGTVTYGGDAPFSELETQYIKSVFDNNPDIDIMYDFHNFSGTQEETYFIWIPTVAGEYVQHMAQNLISRMTRKWKKEYSFIPDDYFAGDVDATNGGMVQNHAHSVGIKFTATFEVCGRWWIEPGTTPYNTTHKVTGVEALTNWLLINLKELEKIK